MKSIKPAARIRGRKSRFLLFPLLLLASLHSQAAFSASTASLNVKIRQLNPDGQVQQVTCAEKQKCDLPIDIQTGSTKETLTVGLHFGRGMLLAEFKSARGYLYAASKLPDNHTIYEPIWHRAVTQGKASTEDVTLLLPAVPNAAMAPILDAAREASLKIAHASVATLEITTQATQ